MHLFCNSFILEKKSINFFVYIVEAEKLTYLKIFFSIIHIFDQYFHHHFIKLQKHNFSMIFHISNRPYDGFDDFIHNFLRFWTVKWHFDQFFNHYTAKKSKKTTLWEDFFQCFTFLMGKWGFWWIFSYFYSKNVKYCHFLRAFLNFLRFWSIFVLILHTNYWKSTFFRIFSIFLHVWSTFSIILHQKPKKRRFLNIFLNFFIILY